MASTAAGTTTVFASINYASGLLGIATVISLLIVVLMKEMGAAGLRGGRTKSGPPVLWRTLNAPIVALLSVFIVILAARIWDVLY